MFRLICEYEKDQTKQSLQNELKKSLEAMQKQDKDAIEEQLEDIAEYILKCKVFEKSQLKIQKKEDLENLSDLIDEFDFDEVNEKLESEEDESQIDDYDSFQSDEEEAAYSDDEMDDSKKQIKREQLQQTRIKKEQELKKKKELQKKNQMLRKQNKAKQIIKIIPFKARLQLKNKLKQAAKKKLDLLKQNKKEQTFLQNAWQILDDTISGILNSFSREKKSQQIEQLIQYLDQEMINPLQELIDFYSLNQ